MNKQLIARCFAKAAASYEEEAAVQRLIASKMTALLDCLPAGRCRMMLEIGCGTGIFSRMLVDRLRPEAALLNDLCPEMRERLEDLLCEHIRFVSGDAETYPFRGQYDLVASCSAVQWFREVEGFFRRIHSLLKPEGLLAFSTFGSDNMREVTALTGKGLSYPSPEALRRMLSGGFELLHVSEEKILRTFKTPKDVLYHLKRTGVTGFDRQRWTKAAFLQFCRDYQTRFGNEREVALTYHPVYIIARKKG
jgi:malonyl-CoA O-methyltransferase/biotin synthesis protein BioG